MKTYIFIFAIADFVSGGPIYNRNKIMYLKERGWRVIVIPLNEGKIYIHGLEEYNKNSCGFLYDSPSEFTRKQREKILDSLAKRIPDDSTDIIIETGSDHMAYWGELLAKKIGAKHFVLLLDENNIRLKSVGMSFMEFKYKRKELACITKETMIKLFDGFRKLDSDSAFGLKCCCSNSVSDYENAFTDTVERRDYNLGYVGRLDKKFVPDIIDAFCSFADSVYPKCVMIALFGGCENNAQDEISSVLKKHTNIKFYISGYMWPLPVKALRKCDMFVSASGSAMATAHAGIPTLAINIYTGKPVGMIENFKNNSITGRDVSDKSITDYMVQVLVEKKLPDIENYDFSQEWIQICDAFDRHMEFINSSEQNLQWYDTGNMILSRKQKVKKFLRTIFGLKLSDRIVNLKREITNR